MRFDFWNGALARLILTFLEFDDEEDAMGAFLANNPATTLVLFELSFPTVGLLTAVVDLTGDDGDGDGEGEKEDFVTFVAVEVLNGEDDTDAPVVFFLVKIAGSFFFLLVGESALGCSDAFLKAAIRVLIDVFMIDSFLFVIR